MKHILQIFATALLLQTLCFAQNEAPDVVKRGFDAYLKSGAQAGIDEWIKGSPVQNDQSGRLQLVGGLTTIESAYGNFTGWELIRVVILSASTRRVYVVAKYEKGPLFMSFDCFKSTEWIIPTLDLNTKANLVLPSNLLGGQ